GLERLRGGHVWVYRTALRAPAELKGGEVVRLVDDRGWFVGKSFYGKQSQISVRLLTREDEPIDEAFFARRLAQARALREASAPDPELRRAGRVVHGEADLLPGLGVDRYGDCLVVQTLIEATDARRQLLADLLQERWKARSRAERRRYPPWTAASAPPRKVGARQRATAPRTSPSRSPTRSTCCGTRPTRARSTTRSSSTRPPSRRTRLPSPPRCEGTRRSTC